METKRPRFNGTRGIDFRLCTLRVNVVLRGRELLGTLPDEGDNQEYSENSVAIIITSLGDNPPRMIRDCQTAKEV